MTLVLGTVGQLNIERFYVIVIIISIIIMMK